MSIKDAVKVLVDFGLLDVILPFMVVFALSFGILERTKVLGKNGLNYNSIVAFVLGFLVVATLQLVNILQSIMQWSAVAILMLVLAMIVRGALGDTQSLSAKQFPKIISALVIGAIALYALGFRNLLSFSIIENILLPALIVIAVLGGILYFILHEHSVPPASSIPSTPAAPSSAPRVPTPPARPNGNNGNSSTDEPDDFFGRYIGRANDLDSARRL